MKSLIVIALLVPTLAWSQTKVGTRIVFDDGSGHTTTVQNPTLTGSLIDTLPNLAGTSGQVLSTNGAGKLSWVTAGGSASGALYGKTLTVSAWVGNQNNVALDTTCSIFRVSSTTDVNLNGISGFGNGRIITIVNVGSHSITIQDENGGSLSANQFYMPSASYAILPPKCSATFFYDGTLLKWQSTANN